MTIEMEDVFFVDYDGRIQIDEDMLIVNAWNEYVKYVDRGGEKICFNDEEFFENTFTNKCDAAWAVSLSGKWQHTDKFVYFSMEGYLTSFTHWDDKNSPINMDKIDIDSLINNLKKNECEQHTC